MIQINDGPLKDVKWNLTDFYKNIEDKKIEEDLRVLNKKIKEFIEKYNNNIKNSSNLVLLSSIKDYEEIEDLTFKISSYSFLIRAINIDDEKIVSFYQNITEKVTSAISKLAFYSIEINKIDFKNLEKMISENDNLKKYQNWFQNIQKIRKHQLSEEMEIFNIEKSVVCVHAWIKLFEEKESSMRFFYKNKSHNITEIFTYLQSYDNQEREESAKIISDVFKNNIDIFVTITNSLAKNKTIDDHFRKFTHPMQSRNLSNDVEDEVVDLLINTVKKNYHDLSHKYYQIKAKVFKKNKLMYWDRNAPYSKKEDIYKKWEDAKKIVLDAYQKFDQRFYEIGESFFKNKWIDAVVSQNKMSGAFSHPTTPSMHPLILLNYNGKNRDVATLAHELGHGIHQVLSSKQGAIMANASLALSETASVFGEQLVFRSLLDNEKNEYNKMLMLAGKIEDMLNTVVRQIAFCEFELLIHTNRKNKELSLNEICEFWMKTQKESFGDYIELTEDYKYYWCYIPHFIHSPFYVYSYAFGDCLVNALYDKYQKQKNGFVEKYINLLKSGSSKHYSVLLAEFDLNPKEEHFWQSGLNVIKSFINEFEDKIEIFDV